MSDVIAIRRSDLRFDPVEESRILAVNEACAYRENPVPCSLALDELCPECSVLAKAIEQALIRAYLVGQASMQEAEEFDKCGDTSSK